MSRHFRFFLLFSPLMHAMAAPRDPVVLPPLQPTSDASRRSTVIFLHGLGDDGRGTGYALAQQFQIHEKLPSTNWVFPTARFDPIVGQRCWYKPHRLDSPATEEADDEEDEEGIMSTVEYIDSLVAAEVKAGTDPSRITVGGFSQGCAVSMIWGLQGQWRGKVAGVFGLSGYFPQIKSARAASNEVAAKWFFAHGMADRLITTKLFAEGQKRLQDYIARDNIEGHVYENMGHDVGGAEVRDFWLWLKMVLRE